MKASLLVELLTEELPPKSLVRLQDAFADEVASEIIKHRLKPRDPNIGDTLAEVLFQRGEIARAIELERAIVAKHPDRADLQAQLKRTPGR